MQENQEQSGSIHILHTPKDVPIELDIIAVHGLNGHYLDTWTHASTPAKPASRWSKLLEKQPGKTDQDTVWLRDLLPQKLPNARIMTFEYDSSIFGNKSAFGVEENAAALLRQLGDVREDEGEGRSIVFIGHSLGGIVIKQAIATANQNRRRLSTPWCADVADSTKGIVFFGTPHRGADKTKWLGLVSGIVQTATNLPKSKFINILETHSADLLEFAEDFKPYVNKYAIASFYEEQPHRLLGSLVVEKVSAVLWLPHEEAVMIGGDHSSMCKFGKNDRRFDLAWRAIRRASKGRVGV
ncbi:hypothetical protein QBC41DRAFT_358852 [Cercophora samala]|uniref:DUF676 domain-containing protein n=1 Tax=Cercophora samala TaxID=330535 RepID=A0AA40D779_9PEZI|nr:hypothetical protein QBC41DRAFT_358852 [Cercophora samala]